ncbi:MAG: hypothetical protein ABIP37_06910 [Methylotenera sp.]
MSAWLAWNGSDVEENVAKMPDKHLKAPTININHATKLTADSGFKLIQREPAIRPFVDLFATEAEEPVEDLNEDKDNTIEPIAHEVPPLPFKFLGMFWEGGDVKYFLQAGEVMYAIKVGDTFAQQYKLIDADSRKLTLMNLPLNITQDLLYGE